MEIKPFNPWSVSGLGLFGPYNARIMAAIAAINALTISFSSENRVFTIHGSRYWSKRDLQHLFDKAANFIDYRPRVIDDEITKEGDYMVKLEYANTHPMFVMSRFLVSDLYYS